MSDETQGTAGSESVTGGSSESQPGGPPSKDAKTMAMLAHLLGIVTGFVGPLIIWLIKKDENTFVDDQGKEALNFQITMVIAYLVSGALTFVCIGFILLPALMVVNLIFCILGGLKANEGIMYRYPVTLRLVK